MLKEQPTFYRKNNYGTAHFYPANKSAQMIVEIAGTKTLYQRMMVRLATVYAVKFTEVLQSQKEI